MRSPATASVGAVSADARHNASSTQMDSRESIAQLAQAKELARPLTEQDRP
jgi:hypothetical protein